MRTFDLAPLYRSTVGFDRLFSMLDGFEAAPGYPPYNIERTGENDYRVTVAVAGFGENELSIEAKENTLTIKGEKQAEGRAERRSALSGHRRARLRARLPACRPRPGQGRDPRERLAARRSRARNPRGQEAAPDPDRQRQLPSRRWSTPKPRPNTQHQSRTAAPRTSGALSFCGLPCGLSRRARRCRRRTDSRAPSALTLKRGADRRLPIRNRRRRIIEKPVRLSNFSAHIAKRPPEAALFPSPRLNG